MTEKREHTWSSSTAKATSGWSAARTAFAREVARLSALVARHPRSHRLCLQLAQNRRHYSCERPKLSRAKDQHCPCRSPRAPSAQEPVIDGGPSCAPSSGSPPTRPSPRSCGPKPCRGRRLSSVLSFSCFCPLSCPIFWQFCPFESAPAQRSPGARWKLHMRDHFITASCAAADFRPARAALAVGPLACVFALAPAVRRGSSARTHACGHTGQFDGVKTIFFADFGRGGFFLSVFRYSS